VDDINPAIFDGDQIDLSACELAVASGGILELQICAL
jgi:hypothetical protein